MSAIEASKLPGMPSAPAFNQKRRADAAFGRRANAVLRARRLNNSGRKRIVASAWSELLTRLPFASVAEIAKTDGMPSEPAVYKRRRLDLQFRRVFDAAMKDTGREIRRGRRPFGEAFARVAGRDALYAAAAEAVRGLGDRSAREDVISEMVLAVLEGEVAIADLKSRARSFVRSYYRKYEGRDEARLSTAVDTRSYDEIASAIAARNWHEGAVNDALRYRDEMLAYHPPTQLRDVYIGQVRRRQAILQQPGLSFEDVEDLLDADCATWRPAI